MSSFQSSKRQYIIMACGIWVIAAPFRIMIGVLCAHWSFDVTVRKPLREDWGKKLSPEGVDGS